MRDTREAVARAVLEQARARGELRQNVDTGLFLGYFRHRSPRVERQGIDSARVRAILDALLIGRWGDRAGRGEKRRLTEQGELARTLLRDGPSTSAE